MLEIGKRLVIGHQLPHGAAVCADDAVIPPFVTRYVFEYRVHRHRNAIDGVIRSHKGARAAFDDAHSEWNRVVLTEKAFIKIGRRTGPGIFVAVGQEMLHQGGGKPVPFVVAL